MPNPPPSRPRTVAIIQRVLPEYRVRFFERLEETLHEQGIRLMLIYGQEQTGEVPASCSLERSWAFKIRNRYFSLGGIRLVWEPALLRLLQADLVVVEQSNSLLVNYLLQCVRPLRRKKLAFWGHGRNLQAVDQNSLSERFKRLLASRVDWWFAYTRVSVEQVAATGFPAERITNVENSIDTVGFQRALDHIEPSELAKKLEDLQIQSPNVLLYCGRMVKGKALEFLFDALLGVKARIPDLHVIFVGGGPEEHQVNRFAQEHPWAHFVGPRFGDERAVYFKLSKALLIPTHLGLAVIDSFVAGTPVITTSARAHSPEIAYLENGLNGRVSGNSVAAYVEAVSDFLISSAEQERLRAGCLQSAARYSLENMVRNFQRGLVRCLERDSDAA